MIIKLSTWSNTTSRKNSWFGLINQNQMSSEIKTQLYILLMIYCCWVLLLLQDWWCFTTMEQFPVRAPAILGLEGNTHNWPLHTWRRKMELWPQMAPLTAWSCTEEKWTRLKYYLSMNARGQIPIARWNFKVNAVLYMAMWWCNWWFFTPKGNTHTFCKMRDNYSPIPF